MSFMKSSVSFTRYRITERIPETLWMDIPAKLRQFAFRDIDDIPEERAFGWTNFDDMLDTEWQQSPPEKADYLAFSLRLETRRIPPAVLKKHTRIAIKAEEALIRQQGRKFVPRDRKKELAEQVKIRLMGRFLPIPAEFQVVWNTRTQIIFFASTQDKVKELFLDLFFRTFALHPEQLTPSSLAIHLLGEGAEKQLDRLSSTTFVAE